MYRTGFGNHGSEDSFGAAIVLLAVLVWILFETWPWWLFAPPLFVFAALAFSPGLRRKVAASFRHEDVEPRTAVFRQKLLWTFWVLGAIAAAVCALNVGLEEMEWWLIPIVLVALAFRLRALSVKPGTWSRLHRAVCNNVLELLLIAGTVLAMYAVAVFWFGSLPLDVTTLGQLIRWDGGIQQTHEFLEHHKPDFWVYLTVLGILFALRLVGSVRPALAPGANLASGWLGKGIKWGERATAAAALAASFTLLAVQEGGPAARIHVALRDALQEYEHFQSGLTHSVDAALREALLAKAWEQRPPILRSEMTESAQFLRERHALEKERAKAIDAFQLQPEETSSFPSAEIPQQESEKATPTETPAASWTPQDLHQAAQEAASLAAPQAAEKSSEAKETVAEVEKSALNSLSPADKLFERIPITAALKVHYPVFGEFLEAISSSVSEASFGAIRSLIVRRITARGLERQTDSLSAIVAEQVSAEVLPLQLQWSRFDEPWARAASQEIHRYRAEVAVAEARLEKQAAAEQRNLVDRAMRSGLESQALAAKASRAVGSDGLLEPSGAPREYLAELSELGKRWPALREADPQLHRELERIRSRVERHFTVEPKISFSAPLTRIQILERSLEPFEPFVEPAPRRHRIEMDQDRPASAVPQVGAWKTPFDGISFLQSYSNEKLIGIVADSAASKTESAALRTILGERYTTYYDTWQEREWIKKQQLESQHSDPAMDPWGMRGPRKGFESGFEPGTKSEPEPPRYEHPMEAP